MLERFLRPTQEPTTRPALRPMVGNPKRNKGTPDGVLTGICEDIVRVRVPYLSPRLLTVVFM